MAKTKYTFGPDGKMTKRTLTVCTMTDGDPFNPKYGTLAADAELSLEEALELAEKLFGPNTTITEESVVSQSKKVPQ